ncbi:MAG: hypothetical protein M1834_004944 [Cirrosporium novae-zelandiae]|nr:MAG: hypothetical protein M1834_004944 [Cirrosporium novae-zelandiae]
MNQIYLYAELLQNIRQITIFASLPTKRNDDTHLELSPDQETLTLYHDGDSASIKLPDRISSYTSLKLRPASDPRDISLRLPLEDQRQQFTYDEIPWLAPDLNATTGVACKSCGDTFIPQMTIREWKDLPNENWAEMMDFWHCHKPEEPKPKSRKRGAKKGYAATEKLTAQPKIGLVDPCFLLLSPTDCSGIMERSDKRLASHATVECAKCHETIGYADENTNGWKLFKWNLSLMSFLGDSKEDFPTACWVSLQLLTLIENNGMRKFVVHSEDEDALALLLWVFTPDLRYSSSHVPNQVTRAMKIFYQRIADPQEALQANSNSADELILPINLLETIQRSLHSTTAILPASAVAFHAWTVGLLNRF